LGLNLQEHRVEPAGVELGQQAREGGLAGGGKTALGVGANAQGAALDLDEAAALKSSRATQRLGVHGGVAPLGGFGKPERILQDASG
jgi:hypothetical protein